jgi:hypothetical protein
MASGRKRRRGRRKKKRIEWRRIRIIALERSWISVTVFLTHQIY